MGRVGVVIVAIALVAYVHAYGYYRDAMPNGLKIPCDASCVGYCEGFGHVLNDGSPTCQGGGEHPNHDLSSFGNTWQKYLAWTVDMCKTDSDGDGLSNGDEMGDPCCTWVTGATPARSTFLSNPAQKDAVHKVPSCAIGAVPNVNLTVGTTTQSTAIINWEGPGCTCGLNVSQTLPTSIPHIMTSVVADPYSSGATLRVSGLEPDMTYMFHITPFNMAGGTMAMITVVTPPVSSSGPGAPTNLKLSTATASSLAFTWSAPTVTAGGDSLAASEITGYELDIAKDGVYTNAYTGSDANCTVSGLVMSTAYVVRVRAVNAQGVGLASETINASTTAYGTAMSANYTSEDGNFFVGWSIIGDAITISMRGKALGYVAIGWGSTPTMLDTDMVVGSYDSTTGTGAVYDLWSTSRNTPSFDTVQDAKFLSGARTTDTTTVTFTRPLATKDTKQDIAITNKNMYMVWAIGSSSAKPGSLSLHSKRGSAQVNFFTGSTSNLNTDKLKNAHAGMAFFVWGMIMPIGSFIARYKKCDMGKWWFRVHVASQISGAILTLISFIIVAVALRQTSSPHFASTHAICGLIMLILTAGQTALGFISHFMYNKQRKRVPVFPDRIHGVLGLATLLFGFITIFLGFDFYHVGLGAWLLGAQCLLFAFTAALVYEFFDGRAMMKDD